MAYQLDMHLAIVGGKRRRKEEGFLQASSFLLQRSSKGCEMDG
jgi:hypothetical protein